MFRVLIVRRKMTAALKRIVKQVKRLSKADRRELHALLESACADAAQLSAEAELEQKLAAEGLLTLPTPPPSVPAALPPPIGTRGRALSEVLLKDRR